MSQPLQNTKIIRKSSFFPDPQQWSFALSAFFTTTSWKDKLAAVFSVGVFNQYLFSHLIQRNCRLVAFFVGFDSNGFVVKVNINPVQIKQFTTLHSGIERKTHQITDLNV